MSTPTEPTTATVKPIACIEGIASGQAWGETIDQALAGFAARHCRPTGGTGTYRVHIARGPTGGRSSRLVNVCVVFNTNGVTINASVCGARTPDTADTSLPDIAAADHVAKAAHSDAVVAWQEAKEKAWSEGEPSWPSAESRERYRDAWEFEYQQVNPCPVLADFKRGVGS